jgi:hypothetical protein
MKFARLLKSICAHIFTARQTTMGCSLDVLEKDIHKVNLLKVENPNILTSRHLEFNTPDFLENTY